MLDEIAEVDSQREDDVLFLFVRQRQPLPTTQLVSNGFVEVGDPFYSW